MFIESKRKKNKQTWEQVLKSIITKAEHKSSSIKGNPKPYKTNPKSSVTILQLLVCLQLSRMLIAMHDGIEATQGVAVNFTNIL